MLERMRRTRSAAPLPAHVGAPLTRREIGNKLRRLDHTDFELSGSQRVDHQDVDSHRCDSDPQKASRAHQPEQTGTGQVK